MCIRIELSGPSRMESISENDCASTAGGIRFGKKIMTMINPDAGTFLYRMYAESNCKGMAIRNVTGQ